MFKGMFKGMFKSKFKGNYFLSVKQVKPRMGYTLGCKTNFTCKLKDKPLTFNVGSWWLDSWNVLPEFDPDILMKDKLKLIFSKRIGVSIKFSDPVPN